MAKRSTGVLIGGLVAAVAVGMVAAPDDDGALRPDPAREDRPAEPTPSPHPASSQDEAASGDAAEVDEASPDGVFIMWARGGLPADVAAGAAELDGVVAASFAITETVGLLDARDPDGRSTADWPDGYRIPLSVAAVDPVAYGQTLGDPDARDDFPAFGTGEVVLSETAAARRNLDVGGQIDLDGRSGLEVAAVLPDAVLRATEVLVHHDDAEALALDRGGSLVVRHHLDSGEEAAALAEALEALVPDDLPARVVGGAPEGGRASAPLVLSLTERKAQFGEFAYRPGSGRDIQVDPTWIEEHIVTRSLPVVGNVTCHRDIMDDLRAALEEVAAAGHGGWLDRSRYGGCYHPRRISENRDRLSAHSWGIAIDFNVDMSLPGMGPVPPDEVIEILGRHNFRWGGDFIHADNHHWEWLGPAAQERPDRSDD